MKPNYHKYDPGGWGGNPRRGAAMGRATIINVDKPLEWNGRLYLSKLRMVDEGAYDNLGTYFGANIGGIGDLWWCAHHDDYAGDIDFVVRAQNREQAKALVRQELPNARFFR